MDFKQHVLACLNACQLHADEWRETYGAPVKTRDIRIMRCFDMMENHLIELKSGDIPDLQSEQSIHEFFLELGVEATLEAGWHEEILSISMFDEFVQALGPEGAAELDSNEDSTEELDIERKREQEKGNQFFLQAYLPAILKTYEHLIHKDKPQPQNRPEYLM